MTVEHKRFRWHILQVAVCVSWLTVENSNILHFMIAACRFQYIGLGPLLSKMCGLWGKGWWVEPTFVCIVGRWTCSRPSPLLRGGAGHQITWSGSIVAQWSLYLDLWSWPWPLLDLLYVMWCNSPPRGLGMVINHNIDNKSGPKDAVSHSLPTLPLSYAGVQGERDRGNLSREHWVQGSPENTYCLLLMYNLLQPCTGWLKKSAHLFVRLNFVIYWPIFKLILLSESGEHL